MSSRLRTKWKVKKSEASRRLVLAKLRIMKKGLGLGLSLADTIVRLHNGSISVLSKPQKGTTFEINLPLILK